MASTKPLTRRQILSNARKDIREAMDSNGEHAHHLIGFALRAVHRQVDIATANKLVDEFGLTELYGIRKLKEQ